MDKYNDIVYRLTDLYCNFEIANSNSINYFITIYDYCSDLEKANVSSEILGDVIDDITNNTTKTISSKIWNSLMMVLPSTKRIVVNRIKEGITFNFGDDIKSELSRIVDKGLAKSTNKELAGDMDKELAGDMDKELAKDINKELAKHIITKSLRGVIDKRDQISRNIRDRIKFSIISSESKIDDIINACNSLTLFNDGDISKLGDFSTFQLDYYLYSVYNVIDNLRKISEHELTVKDNLAAVAKVETSFWNLLDELDKKKLFYRRDIFKSDAAIELLPPCLPEVLAKLILFYDVARDENVMLSRLLK